MSTRKPTAAKAVAGKQAAAGAAAKTTPKSTAGKTAAAAKPSAAGKSAPSARAAVASGEKPATAGRGKAAGAGAAGPSRTADAKPQATAGGKAGAAPAGKLASAKLVAGKAGKPTRDDSRSPANLARAAMLSAEKAREAAKPKKSPYPKAQLAPMRKVLLELRTRIIGDINLMEKEALRADDADVDVENVADHGTDAFERNMTLGLMEGEARTLRLIGEALDAIEAGRYGLCSACGEAIPIARLEALPFAGTCIPCQEQQERRM